ncbi:MAG: S1 family peptidase [Actinomycetota bacterium]|nr:S1 family peptidase [Actinomycetota bacterium]
MRITTTSKSRLVGAAAAFATTVLGAALFVAPTTANAAGEVAVDWAPAETAPITPGVQTNTDGSGQCTANFVFTDSAGGVYIGQAAHCAGTGEATDTDGCLADSLPLGTRVTFNRKGSVVSAGTEVGQGTMVYSSWLTMQARNESDDNTCAYNDFALVKVDADDVGNVNPSIPFWGGPTGINTTGAPAGMRVYSYGNSGLRGGNENLSPKTGFSVGTDSDGWNHPVYTLTPGVPGDSGSAFLDDSGQALGTLSTLAIAPLAGSNGVGDLGRELAYAQQYSGIAGLALANGTEPFDPAL